MPRNGPQSCVSLVYQRIIDSTLKVCYKDLKISDRPGMKCDVILVLQQTLEASFYQRRKELIFSVEIVLPSNHLVQPGISYSIKECLTFFCSNVMLRAET